MEKCRRGLIYQKSSLRIIVCKEEATTTTTTALTNTQVFCRQWFLIYLLYSELFHMLYVSWHMGAAMFGFGWSRIQNTQEIKEEPV